RVGRSRCPLRRRLLGAAGRLHDPSLPAKPVTLLRLPAVLFSDDPVDLLLRHQAPEVLDRSDALLVVRDAENLVELGRKLYLDAEVVGVALQERPRAHAVALIPRQLREREDSLDLAPGADERHPRPRLADLGAPVGVGLHPVATLRELYETDREPRD